VSIVMGDGLKTGVRFPIGAKMLSSSGSGVPTAFYKTCTGGSLVKWPRHDHSPPSGAEVANAWKLYLHSHIRLRGLVFN
jgi:hypothetical protein